MQALDKTVKYFRVRRLTTTFRDYVVVAPREVRPGDIICVLLGRCDLIILLQKRERFGLGGPCYVAGIVQDEAFKIAGRVELNPPTK